MYVHSMNPSVGHMLRLADTLIIIKSVSLVKYRPTNLFRADTYSKKSIQVEQSGTKLLDFFQNTC